MFARKRVGSRYSIDWQPGMQDCKVEYGVKDLPTVGFELMTTIKLHKNPFLKKNMKLDWP